MKLVKNTKNAIKKNYRKRKYASPLTLTKFQRFPVPEKMKQELRYMEVSLAVNPGSLGVAADMVFSANSLYDPNVTLTGHQPCGFDQLMLMYNHYTVIASKITVVFKNQDTSSLQWAGVAVRASADPILNGQEAVENGNNVVTYVDVLGSSNGIKEVTYPLSIGDYMGRHNILSEDDFRGTASSSPFEQVYFHVFGFPNTTLDTSQLSAHVIIDYVAIFTEPKEMAQS